MKWSRLIRAQGCAVLVLWRVSVSIVWGRECTGLMVAWQRRNTEWVRGEHWIGLQDVAQRELVWQPPINARPLGSDLERRAP